MQTHLLSMITQTFSNILQYQSSSSLRRVVVKRIQGGTKHDITLKLCNTCAWDVATLTLHPYGNQTKLFPFRVETRLGAKRWIEYPAGCEIHASTKPRSFLSVRAQFCKLYYDQQIQFTLDINGKRAHTSMPIVLKRYKRKTATKSKYTAHREGESQSRDNNHR